VTSLPNPASQGKPKLGESNGDRELLGQAIRTATAQVKLTASKVESIAAALRQRSITIEEALQWADDERISHLLQFGPPSKTGSAR